MKAKALVLTAASCALLTAGTAFAEGDVVSIDLSGVESWDLSGSPNNTILEIDLAELAGGNSGDEVTITGVGWDLIYNTVGDSWVSEQQMRFADSSGNDAGLFITPGVGNDAPGENVILSSDGVIKLADVGIPDLVLSDGVLLIEFQETFDDVSDAVDGFYKEGSVLNIQVVPIPAPAALALLGVAAVSRRRRRA